MAGQVNFGINDNFGIFFDNVPGNTGNKMNILIVIINSFDPVIISEVTVNGFLGV